MSCHYLKRLPDVTVLMSCFNANRWLGEAIESVLAQTFGNYEFIIIDDGSVDNSRDIIQQYANTDSRIVTILKTNTGLADSLNRGIQKARGKWIARLDADDVCEPARLEEQVDFVRSNKNILLLGSGFFEINEYGSIIKKNIYPTKHSSLLRNLELSKRFFPHSSAFYSTEVARMIGGYNSRFKRAEDKRLWLEFALRGEISCLNKPLVRIRKHLNQISHDQGGERQINDSIAATTCHFIVKQGEKDPSLILNDMGWADFLRWIDRRVAEAGIIENHKYKAFVRSEYISKEGKKRSFFFGFCNLLSSGRSVSILMEKIRGNGLPKKLAREWQSRLTQSGNY